jgi:hypothetical protein
MRIDSNSLNHGAQGIASPGGETVPATTGLNRGRPTYLHLAVDSSGSKIGSRSVLPLVLTAGMSP